jgi:hypothetical protein
MQQTSKILFKNGFAVGPCCSKMVAQTYDNHAFWTVDIRCVLSPWVDTARLPRLRALPRARSLARQWQSDTTDVGSPVSLFTKPLVNRTRPSVNLTNGDHSLHQQQLFAFTFIVLSPLLLPESSQLAQCRPLLKVGQFPLLLNMHHH